MHNFQAIYTDCLLGRIKLFHSVFRGIRLVSTKIILPIFMFLSTCSMAETADTVKHADRLSIVSKHNADKMHDASINHQDGVGDNKVETVVEGSTNASKAKHDSNGIDNLSGQSALVEFPMSQMIVTEQHWVEWNNISGFYTDINEVGKDKDGLDNPFFSYKHLIEDIRSGLGENIYGKLVWTYYDVKELDNWLYANIMRYDFRQSYLYGKFQQLSGIDEQLSTMLVFGNDQELFGHGNKQGNGVNGSGNTPHGKVVLDFAARNTLNGDVVENGYIELVVKFLTIRNVLYILLGIMSVGMLFRVFRFFIKQDLS